MSWQHHICLRHWAYHPVIRGMSHFTVHNR
jgi:hypothetical protein